MSLEFMRLELLRLPMVAGNSERVESSMSGQWLPVHAV